MAAPSSSVHTMVKIIGAIAWLAGLVLLFLFPPMGFLILLIAIVLSILSLTWTRQARHAEVVAAAKAQPSPAPPLKKSTADRLVELDALRAAGTITESEYEAQRAQILGEV